MKIILSRTEKRLMQNITFAVAKAIGEKPVPLIEDLGNAGAHLEERGDDLFVEFSQERTIVFLEGVEEVINVFGAAAKKLMGCWEMLDGAMSNLGQKYKARFKELKDCDNA